jgi:hypothetical protein
MRNERMPPPPNNNSQNGTRKRCIDEVDEDLNLTGIRNQHAWATDWKKWKTVLEATVDNRLRCL